MRTTSRFLVAALLCVGIAGATGFTNGSFTCSTPGVPQNCGFSGVPAGQYWQFLAPGDNTSIPGWAVGDAGVNWVYEYDPANGKGWNTTLTPPSNNGDTQHYSVGLQGYDNALIGTTPGPWQAGTIKQTFDTTPGVTYRLDYLYSGAPAADSTKLFVQADVRAIGLAVQTITYTFAGHPDYVGGSNLAWTAGYYQWTAEANTTTSTIAFQSNEIGAPVDKQGGIILDGLVFREAGIPEPGTMSMMFGAGLLGLAWVMRRKR